MEKKNPKSILIATGIYPPQIGGPAEYAKNLEEVWQKEGKEVLIATFGFERKLPTGLRHFYFLIRNFSKVWRADFILVLDTWSVALPTVLACLVLRKQFTIRTGGDFLWESYVERTKKKVLFRNFYKTEIVHFNFKERIIFKTTQSILEQASKIVFSTNWQRDIWTKPYSLALEKTKIVENFYGEKVQFELNIDKVFIGSCRNLVWKNLDTLKEIFEDREIVDLGFSLDLKHYNYQDFIEKIKTSYAVVLVSLGDISPNMILDAIKLNKPFICTKECGLYNKLSSIGIWVDPCDVSDIKEKILWLSKEENYKVEKQKIIEFNFTHSWQEIVKEILI